VPTAHPATRRTARRMGTVSLIVGIVVAAFMVRLVDIQVVRASELSAESAERRTSTQMLWAERGRILDRNFQALAENADRYDVTASPRHVSDFRRGGVAVSVMDALAEIEAITGTPAAEMYAAVTTDPESDFAYLSKDATTAQYRQVIDLDIPWVYFERTADRYYPFGSTAGNLTGMMGTDGPLEGVELKWDGCLQAEHGTLTYQHGADYVKLPGTTQISTPPINGGDVVLTIDSDLQWFVLQQLASTGQSLGAQSGSAMVVEVATGEILAAADWPTFDPNDFSNTPQSNLRAATFTSAFEPGSTLKTITMAALLEEGLTYPEEQFEVPATYAIPGGRYIRNAGGGAAGNLTTTGILSRSSNTGTVILGERISPKTLNKYFTKFGFGQSTSVDFLGEQSGYMQDPDTIDSVTVHTQTFGQGMSSTMAQMASAYQAIANGGEKLPLRMMTGCSQQDGTFDAVDKGDPERVISESTAKTLISMLETVPQGGTLQYRVNVPGYRIAAKTGTAEIAENGVYGNERMISIAGMVPADDPQFVVVVAFVKPQTNRFSYAAAPVFDEIVTHLVKHYRIPPSSAQPTLPPITW